jgi:26S proteasome regulatory subunit N1
MTFPDKRDALAFRFLGSLEPVGSWGHEYVRHLSSEIIQEYAYRLEQEKPTDDLLALAKEIVPFFLSHNAEADGCDLLLELEALDVLLNHIDENTYGRVALYLISCASYLPVPEDINTLVVVHKIYTKFKKYAQAMAIAIKLNNKEMIIQDYQSCEDPNLKRQLSFMLARQLFNIGELTGDIDNCLSEILNNSKLSERYLALGRELDVLEPKLPEDIYKSYLENTRSFGGSHVDSALQNLASTFTNAFLNCGFGSDKLLLQSDETNSWIYKNKEFGMLSATASLGSILMWDIDMGLTAIDKFLYSSDDFIKAGALLAVGILCSSVRNDADPAMALLSEHIGDKNANIRTSCILGLGIAYAGSGRSDVLELLLPIVSDISVHIEQASLAALALGLVFVGTCNGDITSTILQTLMERDPSSLSNTYTRFMTLGLGLLFLAKQEAAEVTLETLKAIDHPISKQAGVFVEGCAFCATGNVLKIQHMLHICSDHLEPGEDAHQGFATLAIAMISMGEEIGSQMALRTFNHLVSTVIDSRCITVNLLSDV